jgi:trans-aconitate methyltransferase
VTPPPEESAQQPARTSGQTWDPERYRRNASFVPELGRPLIELLAPRPGERVLDLGCGDGALTVVLRDLGCQVVGIDSSAAQVESARSRGLDARVADARALTFDGEFDAVFSNAVLHWIQDPEPMFGGVRRALRPGGRFVAELGGHGCVDTIHRALVEELDARGYNGRAASPWYFPTASEYRVRLERAGFRVTHAELFDRPTPLPGDILGWLETFAESFTGPLQPAERTSYLAAVRDRIAPRLQAADGSWTADYVRLRFAAHVPPAGSPPHRG